MAEINPFRYRGYYYDTETGFYYLQTRYYDPEAMRFINAVDFSGLTALVYGALNLYCYLGNNPIWVAYSASNGVSSIGLSADNGAMSRSSGSSTSTSKKLSSFPGWIETLSAAIDHSFSIINPIRSVGYIAKYQNLWDLMRLDGIIELPGTLSKVATGIGWGLGFVGGVITGYEKYVSGASVISSILGGAINAGISIGGMYATTALASLSMAAMTMVNVPGGIVVLGGVAIVIFAGVGINYLFTEVDFFGNTIEGHLNNFVDWLIFWD